MTDPAIPEAEESRSPAGRSARVGALVFGLVLGAVPSVLLFALLPPGPAPAPAGDARQDVAPLVEAPLSTPPSPLQSPLPPEPEAARVADLPSPESVAPPAQPRPSDVLPSEAPAAAPSPPAGEEGGAAAESAALPPLPSVEVAVRPEPKKPRDMLLPGEVLKRESPAPPTPYRPPAARSAGDPRYSVLPLPPKPAAAPPPSRPANPPRAAQARPRGDTGQGKAASIRLGPCGPAETRYMRDGVEVDAFGRPCDPF